jgi:hypothetical protein
MLDEKEKELYTMPYVLTSESGFVTEESWINASCKYDFSSLCFMMQYYACQCNKKSTSFVKETKNWNPPLPLETSTISCTVKVCRNFSRSKWSHSTILDTAPFRTQAEKPASRSHFTTNGHSFSQSVLLCIEPVVGLITKIKLICWILLAVIRRASCLPGVRVCPWKSPSFQDVFVHF